MEQSSLYQRRNLGPKNLKVDYFYKLGTTRFNEKLKQSSKISKVINSELPYLEEISQMNAAELYELRMV